MITFLRFLAVAVALLSGLSAQAVPIAADRAASAAKHRATVLAPWRLAEFSCGLIGIPAMRRRRGVKAAARAA